VGLAGASLKLALFNQSGQEVSLASLRGGLALIAFIDTGCPGACKLTTDKLRLVAQELGPEATGQTRFVLATYNPVFDGPTRIARYAKDMRLDGSRWLVLTGSPGEIDRMLRRFGLPAIGSVQDPAQLMDAMDYLFLVAADGHIVKRYKGGEFVTTVVAEDTRAALGTKGL
jgi:cytochrome oxidase Cu insertion factor (SCO1/SenC/PrrC family)